MNTPVALITGGAKRIGASLVQTLHQRGFNIALHYRHSYPEAQALADQLNAERADSVLLLAADASDLETLASFAAQIEHTFGRLDVFIHNASSFYPTPIGNTTPKDWQELLDSNVTMAFFLSQSLLPLLRQQANSQIVFITDIHAEKALKHYSVYGLAKAALSHLMKSLALELAPDIRVNAIAPGWVLVNPHVEALTDQHIQQRLAKIPLQRIGSPQAICQALCYLLDSDYITGHTLEIDGGRHLT